MIRKTVLASGLGLTLALGPALTAGAAPAAPPATVALSAQTVPSAATRTASKITLKRSAASYYRGHRGVVVSAAVTANRRAASGTVSFYDGTKRLRTVRLVKGRAAYRLPTTLSARVHTITVRYRPASTRVAASAARTRVTVHSLSVRTNRTVYTLYMNNYVPVHVAAAHTGKVTGPWADFWLNTIRKQTAGDQMVLLKGAAGRGTWRGKGTEWLTANPYSRAMKKPGTYRWYVTFTPTISAVDAVARTRITVVVKSNVMEVGTDIQPGTYRLAASEGGYCNYTIKGADGYTRVSEYSKGTKTAVVQPTDTEFSFTSCGSGPTR